MSIDRVWRARTIEDGLVAKGYHPSTGWWREQRGRFYASPTIRRGIFQVGRGGAKSMEARRFAETEMLSQWNIGAGERHYFAWVSENVEEAAQRPRQIEEELKALGVPCTRTGNTVDIDGMRVGFKAFPCRVGAVSGFRCIGFVCDEEAKWRSDDTNANPASEVVASLRAMCVTHPEAREWHLSSPFSTVDYHYEQFAKGDTDQQIAANAPSWVANPDAITEEQTRKLEDDPRIWAREYAARPSAAAGLAFGDPEQVEACFGELPVGFLLGDVIVGIDASDALQGGDGFGYCVGFWAQPDPTPRAKWAMIPGTDIQAYPMRDERGYPVMEPVPDRPIFRVCEAGEFVQESGVTQEAIIDRIATRAKAWRARFVTGDTYSRNSVEGHFSQRGLQTVLLPWTAPAKESAVATLRRMIREQALSIVPHAGLRKEMLSLKFRMTRGGHTEYHTTGMDTVASLIAIAIYMNDPDAARLPDRSPLPLAGTPYRSFGARREIVPGR
jgi:hypothetical protein